MVRKEPQVRPWHRRTELNQKLVASDTSTLEGEIKNCEIILFEYIINIKEDQYRF
jgi:hypothetical protein